ncbi:MAG: tol-pal system protein YbgF [Pseudodesulfovibrio sp.]|uniref:Tol-pal system protein YbgF n=1 Tax=Pseudodesulfovibrio aespoeensis (strain ATCC 700646 / DSM 10631 / Aspo-2) TaxID=643562 RepID=E6VZQ0_PSEA9|nr:MULTISPECIES: tol-pal system protein YbgF [Pseudodesulfovibrio]MBU4191169.1 tol-pal system protein YbgF [Pseudomonadota bacterium]ADU62878.1 tol-pal system protein YbgF [Pseudodesulfovibrio aespoeensis Aspo-2]MBU4244728.1 tol-pal system protein YbgF [Pseudomonadota bacterium]MBU4379508.1 tol-pal system protein YbgF [Pseudomonadota bacterium]MBU4473680.1 tol-pal system protein YbgF [Pseudomonadota bacterium]
MKYMTLCLLAVFSLLAVGCTATRQTAATTEASTEWRIKNLEENFLNFREEQRKQADQSVAAAEALDRRLAGIESDLAVLRGGEVVVAAPGDEPRSEGWVSDESGPDDLKPEEGGWVSSDSGTPGPAAESGEEKPWAEVPGAPVTIPEPTVISRSPVPAPAKAAPAPAKVSAMGAQATYDAGLAKYNGGDFEGARGAFDEFLKKYSSDGLTPNALYWKGETYYSQKDYAQAILTFKEVTSRYPKHAKSASALLKIGMSYDRVGDPDNAVFYLRALVEDFPKSAPATLARKELTRLGG